MPGPTRSTRADLEALDRIIALIYERSRIRLSRNKEALIRARLGKRMRSLHLETLAEYCDYLLSHEGAQEVQQAVDAISTNFTHFLRERLHFEVTVDQALPGLLSSHQKRFRTWSAACATGEEAYSLAFYLESRFPAAEGWDWNVLATDISGRALEKAAQAIYPEDKLAEIPHDWRIS